jgi:GAF domain-containing protein
MALISFVDEQRHWMSAGVGIDAAQTPQLISFCTYAIRGGRTTVVEDGLNDLRLATNPLIRGGAGLRFYAGVPLRTAGGTRLGTLAALDRETRSLSADQVERLEQLAECAVAMLETAHARASAPARQAAAA